MDRSAGDQDAARVRGEASHAGSMDNRRRQIQEASKVITVLFAKIEAAIGDSVRMQAALLEANDVLEHIVNIFSDLRDEMVEGDKRNQLDELNTQVAFVCVCSCVYVLVCVRVRVCTCS